MLGVTLDAGSERWPLIVPQTRVIWHFSTSVPTLIEFGSQELYHVGFVWHQVQYECLLVLQIRFFDKKIVKHNSKKNNGFYQWSDAWDSMDEYMRFGH